MEWWRNAVIYQIYPKSFLDSNHDGIGDIPGIMEKLDYIRNLGADAIWICPVFDSPQEDNGYDVSDYLRIWPGYGTNEQFYALIEQAHRRNLKVIMDLPINHTSDRHVWFQKSRDPASGYRDYYIWRKGKDGRPPNNWASEFSGSAWEFDERSGEYYFHSFARSQPDLNWENTRVRNEIFDIIDFWNQKGVDGWRLDAVTHIDKQEGLPDYPSDLNDEGRCYLGCYHDKGGRLQEYLQDLRRHTSSGGSLIIGELSGRYDSKDALKLIQSGCMEMCISFEHLSMDMDGQSSYPRWSVIPLDLNRLKRNLSKGQQLIASGGWNALYFNNHDQPRAVSRWGDEGGFRCASAKMLAITLHMLGGTPFVYQGEEIGMTNCPFDLPEYRDVEIVNSYRELVLTGLLKKDVFLKAAAYRGRDNSRTPMQWDTTEFAGFSSVQPWIKVNRNYKKINVKAELANQDSIFYCYQKLIAFRKLYDNQAFENFELVEAENPSVFAFRRSCRGKILLVISNFKPFSVPFGIPENLQRKKGTILISNHKRRIVPAGDFLLKPYESFAVYYQPDSLPGRP